MYIITFTRTTYGPAMGYVLPCLAVDEEELHSVQSRLLTAVSTKVRFIKQNTNTLTPWPTGNGRTRITRPTHGNGTLSIKTPP
jgi:hypothetical protein